MAIFKGAKTRTFKGKRYRYEFELIRKSSAEQYAKTLREEGKEARITYEGKVVGWVVWSRTPKGREAAEKKKVFSGKYHVVADDQREAERKANKIDKAQGSLYLGRLKRSTAASLTRTKPVRITPKVGRLR